MTAGDWICVRSIFGVVGVKRVARRGLVNRSVSLVVRLGLDRWKFRRSCGGLSRPCESIGVCVTEGELWQGSAAVCGAGDDGWQQPSFFFLAVV